MEFKTIVNSDFMEYREQCFEQYNANGRTDRKFLMDLDCEIIEHTLIAAGEWQSGLDIGNNWEVDAVIDGKNVDLKVIGGAYWNISPRRIVNILRQRNLIHEYHFWQWLVRPSRPLRIGDEVSAVRRGILTYDQVADNVNASFKQAGGHYVDLFGKYGLLN